MTNLTETEHRMLAFEQRRWLHVGSREDAILTEFGISHTLYQQRLNTLIDRPEALAAAPMLVKRLRRLRQARRDARTG